MESWEMLPRVQNLISKLIQADSLDWKQEDANTFYLELGRGTIRIRSRIKGGSWIFDFEVLDSTDEILDSVSTYDFDEGYEALNSLWEKARAEALNIDNLYRDMFENLQ